MAGKLKQGSRALRGGAPLYSGLFVPALSPDELAQAVRASVEGGAQGVSLFSAAAMTEAHWERFSSAVKSL